MSFDKLDPPVDEPSHSLPEALRWDARHREGMEDSSRDLMRMAADALESYQSAYRKRWEHEAATAGVGDLPLIPMREDYNDRSDWRDAMVAWVRAVTAVDQSRDA